MMGNSATGPTIAAVVVTKRKAPRLRPIFPGGANVAKREETHGWYAASPTACMIWRVAAAQGLVTAGMTVVGTQNPQAPISMTKGAPFLSARGPK